MALFSELDVLKEIPGYQAIMKGVVKSLIQILIEQLSAHTGEESVILTASITDGTLSHLGSESGKVFLEENDDIKTKFLGFCLRRHHKRKAPEAVPSFDGETASIYPTSMHKITPTRKVASQRRAGLSLSSPYSINRQLSLTPTGSNFTSKTLFRNEDVTIKQESSVPDAMDQKAGNQDTAFEDPSEGAAVKVEPLDEEIEITGVDLGPAGEQDQNNSSFDSNQWFQSAAEGTDYFRTLGETNDPVNIGEQLGMAKALYANSPLTNKRSWIGMQCETCGKHFYSKVDLQRHRTKHTGERAYSCDLCGKTFTLKGNMVAHKKRQHGVITVE